MTDSALPPPAGASDVLALPRELWRPRPRTGDELVALIRDLLAYWGLDPQVVQAIEVDADLAGTDVTRLRMAASGVVLPSLGGPPEIPLPPGGLAELPGRLEEFQLTASDVRWEQASVDGTAQVYGAALGWLMQDDLLVGVRLSEGASGMRGTIRLETGLEPLVESIRLTLNRQLGQHGAQVRKLAVRASDLGQRRYRVQGEAAARWKALPLSARLSAVASIDDDLVLRFSDVQVSSRNPLCAAVLAFSRRQVQEGFAEPVPLREGFGPELTELILRVEPRVLVEASFADLR